MKGKTQNMFIYGGLLVAFIVTTVLKEVNTNGKENIFKTELTRSETELLTTTRRLNKLTDSIGLSMGINFKISQMNQDKLAVIVRDSSKTRVIAPENPTLVIYTEDERGWFRITNLKDTASSKYNFQIPFSSKNATCTHFKLIGSVFLMDSGNTKMFYIGRTDLLDYDCVLSKDFVIASGGSFNKQVQRIFPFQFIAIWIRGTYTNSDNSKTFSINEMYLNDIYKNINGNLALFRKNEMIKEIENKEKEMGLSLKYK